MDIRNFGDFSNALDILVTILGVHLKEMESQHF
jgi:hypothetical protein